MPVKGIFVGNMAIGTMAKQFPDVRKLKAPERGLII